MKMFKIFGIIILILFAIIAIFLIASTINHQSQLRKEARAHFPTDSLVKVNDKNLHVHVEGEGDLTLVFLSGHGTNSPVLDFKPLWVKLAGAYRIAVVERPGYGWSEPSNGPRDIDTLLEETRKALELSGERGPYVLFPHSMSGLEAIYWAQKYPDEVRAIIGLDPCVPESFDVLPEPEKSQLHIMYIVSRTGLSRYMPDAEVENFFPLMGSDDLSEADKQQYLAAFYRSSYSRDMVREVDYLRENAKTVAGNEVPINTPMYFFISEGQEEVAAGWNEVLTGYLSGITNGKHMQLASDHYVHYENTDKIAEEAMAFLEELGY
jgi:pimeloyl-ACP methyl ester carboxylesterase